MDNGPAPPARRAALAAAVVLLVLQALVAWAPFRLDPPRLTDNAAQLSSGEALVIDGPRAEATVTLNPEPGAASLSAVLEIHSAERFQAGPKPILTALDADGRGLVLAQQGSDLGVWPRDPGAAPEQRPPLRVADAFDSDAPAPLTVLAAREGSRLTLAAETTNGSAPATPTQDDADTARVGGPAGELHAEEPVDWDAVASVTLGDAPAGGRAWQGRIETATLTRDGTTADLLDPAALRLAERTWYVPQRVREVTEVPPSSAQRRALLHLFAFAVVGVLLAMASRSRRRVRRVALLAATASVTLQLGKVLIDGRHPSLLDLGAHVLGAALGALVITQWRSRRRGASQAA